ncbi:hypothetical protein [Rhodosalinus sp. K401]|uniref:hypothetical protein n=1 Tax=Rhodosalinus sp. K401 TaxID=3239195 RepID=UPI00352370F2
MNRLIRATTPLIIDSTPSIRAFAAWKAKSPMASGSAPQVAFTASNAPEKVATVLLPQPTTASVAPCRPSRIVACAAAQPASTRAQAAPARSAIRSQASAATSFSRPSASPMPPVAATRRVNW